LLGTQDGQLAPTPLPAPPPYVSLACYDAQHRALFAGRDDDVLRFAELLDTPETRILVLHGETGVGKSSFLRAGVIPYLEDDCLGYRFLRDRSARASAAPGTPQSAEAETGSRIVFVRATNHPIAQLARELCRYWSRSYTFRTPSGKNSAVDLVARVTESLRQDDMRETLVRALQAPSDPAAWTAALRDDARLLGRLLIALRSALPFGLVVVIDQCEEMFTLARTADDIENRRLALEMWRRLLTVVGDFKVILSLRTEYHGRLTDGLRHGPQEVKGVRDYLLTDFGREQLLDAILRPTSPVPVVTPILHTADAPIEHYRFRYEDGLAEQIADEALHLRSNRQDSVLPLVQIICSQLYELSRSGGGNRRRWWGRGCVGRPGRSGSSRRCGAVPGPPGRYPRPGCCRSG
jgi:hypothetical protein